MTDQPRPRGRYFEEFAVGDKITTAGRTVTETDNLLFCAEKGIPGAYLPSPNTGGGGPITVGSGVTQATLDLGPSDWVVDFNASASGYLRNLWNGTATGTGAGTIAGPDTNGYYTVTLTVTDENKRALYYNEEFRDVVGAELQPGVAVPGSKRHRSPTGEYVEEALQITPGARTMSGVCRSSWCAPMLL